MFDVIQVYERLQKLCLSMSHKSTIRLVIQLGKNHDDQVKKWRDSFLLDVASLHVPSYEEVGKNNESSETSSSDCSSEEDNDSLADSSSSDSDFTSGTETDDVGIPSSVEQLPVGPMIVRPPVVLEPSDIIKVSPGLPLQLRHQGFRLCGDNIDKNISRRYLRSDRRNQSVHYFHAYAVENRIDVSKLSDVSIPMSEVTTHDYVPNSILPRHGDDTIIKENIAILISRILYERLSFFNFSFDGVIQWHIKHKYSAEMSCKSVVVSIATTYDLC